MARKKHGYQALCARSCDRQLLRCDQAKTFCLCAGHGRTPRDGRHPLHARCACRSPTGLCGDHLRPHSRFQGVYRPTQARAHAPQRPAYPGCRHHQAPDRPSALAHWAGPQRRERLLSDAQRSPWLFRSPIRTAQMCLNLQQGSTRNHDSVWKVSSALGAAFDPKHPAPAQAHWQNLHLLQAAQRAFQALIFVATLDIRHHSSGSSHLFAVAS